jgi:O-antigen ligase
LAIFFLISAISIFQAGIAGLAWYRLAKLGEFILLFLYVRSNLKKTFSLETTAAIIVGSGFFQAVIAIIQYAKQGSIGLKILGESHVAPEIYNVAVFIGTNGVKYLRAYGTTPHPNVLSAFLVFALFAFYYFYFKNQKYRSGCLVIYSLMVFALLFTFSRTMIGIWGLASVFLFLFMKQYRKIFLPVAITTLSIGILFSIFFWPQVKARILISGSEEAVTQRIFYNEIAGGVTKSSPILGVGIGQSVSDLMHRFRYYPQYFYQPVHNIYLIISSETGFLGLSAFLLFLFSLFTNKFNEGRPRRTRAALISLIFCFSFLLIGLFDHFFWTLQQGSLIFWLALAILTL